MSDLFRNTWVRYVGYSREIYEGARGILPLPHSWGYWSHQLMMIYIISDVVDKTLKKMAKDSRPTKAVVAMGDAIIWQSLATAIIPNLLLSRFRSYTYCTLSTHPSLCKLVPHKSRALVTGLLAIAVIPLVAPPIDFGVTLLMNTTYRQIFGR